MILQRSVILHIQLQGSCAQLSQPRVTKSIPLDLDAIAVSARLPIGEARAQEVG